MRKLPRRPQDYIVAALFVVVLSGLIYAGTRAWEYRREYKRMPDISGYEVKGVDISAHNGKVDFEKLKASGIDFVFMKASEGTDFRDKSFIDNYDRAQAAGLPVGVYHFFRYDRDGLAQAMNLYGALKGRVPVLGVVIDLEDEGNPVEGDTDTILSNLSDMIDYLNLRGLTVMFYTNKDGYNRFLRRDYVGYTLWICSFSDEPIDAEWRFWQYSHSGKVNGVPGEVDLNLFNGSRQEWDAYLKLMQTPDSTAAPDTLPTALFPSDELFAQ